MARYNWVGFYLVDTADPGMLVVGPYVGSFSPNDRIPINKGLCGAAATTRQTVVVNDVAADPRYLSGSEIVKANMVVPILAKNQLVAELDIESYFTNTFTKTEQTFAEDSRRSGREVYGEETVGKRRMYVVHADLATTQWPTPMF